MFSWLFMILFLLAYFASVGWSIVTQESKILDGEEGDYDIDFSFLSIWVFGPFYILRDLFSSIAEFIYGGIMMLCSEDFREGYLESKQDEEE